jgi:hypothetical protein
MMPIGFPAGILHALTGPAEALSISSGVAIPTYRS